MTGGIRVREVGVLWTERGSVGKIRRTFGGGNPKIKSII
jgi:hypothetical protein